MSVTIPLGPSQVNLLAAINRNKLNLDMSLWHDSLWLSSEQLRVFEDKSALVMFCQHHSIDAMPYTTMVDELNYQAKLTQGVSEIPCRWILKPCVMNNGRGIRLLGSIEEIEAYFRSAHRFSGRHVLQQYIEPPWLRGGCKFSLRMLVLLMTGKGGYLYRRGYINQCRTVYQDSFDCPQAHLTNEHLLGPGRVNSIQYVTDDWLDYPKVLPKISQICKQLLDGYLLDNTQNINNQMAFLGVDFIFSQDEKPYLLEINHGPCFPTDLNHPLYDCFYKEFWDNSSRLIVSNLLSGAVTYQGDDAFVKLTQ